MFQQIQKGIDSKSGITVPQPVAGDMEEPVKEFFCSSCTGGEPGFIKKTVDGLHIRDPLQIMTGIGIIPCEYDGR